jgi:hypothetical protein
MRAHGCGYALLTIMYTMFGRSTFELAATFTLAVQRQVKGGISS